MSTLLFKIAAGAGLAAFSAAVYYRLQEINDVLGTSLIENADRLFR
jgi:hypothetical protein